VVADAVDARPDVLPDAAPDATLDVQLDTVNIGLDSQPEAAPADAADGG
jgi:hypothetical protein